jgi:signal transduction histidine kinase
MMDGRKRLRILNGFRASSPRVMSSRAAHVPVTERSQDFRPLWSDDTNIQDLNEALKAMEQRLNALLEDRSRLGRDLHDGILQSLYAIGLSLEAVRRANLPQSPEADRAHHGVIGQINQLINEIRHAIRGLTEGTVQDFDLFSELLALRATYDQVGRVRITLDLEPEALEVLTKEEEREILHIVREALSNCMRHAHATHVELALRRRGEKIQLAIRDDGTGFSTADGSTKRGYGLANMETRARKIGGTLRVRSACGHGTDITAEFTLEPMLVPV